MLVASVRELVVAAADDSILSTSSGQGNHVATHRSHGSLPITPTLSSREVFRAAAGEPHPPKSITNFGHPDSVNDRIREAFYENQTVRRDSENHSSASRQR